MLMLSNADSTQWYCWTILHEILMILWSWFLVKKMRLGGFWEKIPSKQKKKLLHERGSVSWRLATLKNTYPIAEDSSKKVHFTSFPHSNSFDLILQSRCFPHDMSFVLVTCILSLLCLLSFLLLQGMNKQMDPLSENSSNFWNYWHNNSKVI